MRPVKRITALDWIEKELHALAGVSLERELVEYTPANGLPGHTMREGRLLLDLSSNDYLGLTGHPVIAAAMSRAAHDEGNGAGASRLVTGNRPAYGRLERMLAEWQGKEAALVFANGYAANIGVIGSLAGRGDAVFSDRLNHASIVDGIALSRAEHARYRHNDPEHLRWLLEKNRHARRKLIVTDAVFSMDGDKAMLGELVLLKREFGAMLMVDEAHSGGVYGRHGEGLSRTLGLQEDVDVHMGTFSKAFGVYGGYVCGNRSLIRWLINKARALVYSTALPPAVIGGVIAALELVRKEAWRRERLTETTGTFRASLRAAGFDVGYSDSPIVPVIVGDSAAALRFGAALAEEGIAAVAIRPPTVPGGTARIRFTLSSSHDDSVMKAAAEKIRKAGMKAGVLTP